MFGVLNKKSGGTRSRQELEEENRALKEEVRRLRHTLGEQGNGRNRISQLNDLMHLENTTLQHGMGDIQKYLASAVETAKGSLTDITATRDEFSTLAIRIDQVNGDMHSLVKESSHSRTSIRTMMDSTDKISSVLETIKNIANQINLISLNAAVEAARAGSAGKGFAVVANEVKLLAEQTKTALSDIENVVGSLTDSVKEVESTSNKMTGLADTTGNLVTQFKQELDEVDVGLGVKFERIARTTDKVFLSLAKLDHLIWNVNTYASVNQGHTVIDFVDHHQCRLGKWYEQGEGKAYFSDSPAYNHLLTPHAAVHQKTGEIFKLLQQPEIDYEQLLDHFQSLSQSSKEVISILGDLGEHQESKR